MEYTKLLGKVTLTCDGKHDSSKEYDRLCLVYDEQYKSFISIKEVPSNISITNESYWQPINVMSADGEDLTVDESLNLKFANRQYDPSQYSGMGRKILRKTVVNNKNILTQADFDSSDTIYVIQYEFDLQDATITIPANSTLSFEGGRLINGNVVLNETQLLPQGLNLTECIERGVKGTFKDGQLYYDADKDSLIALTSNKIIDLTTPIVNNTYTRYNWIKYSPSQYGDQMTDEPQPDTKYLGIAANKDEAEPSNNPLDYLWVRVKGEDGVKGDKGEKGDKGDAGDKGEKGDPGTAGKDGVGLKPNYNAFVFKQADTIPNKPTFTVPDPGTVGINGWFRAPETIGRWWMSTGTVDGRNDVVISWSDPVQCTAEDGLTNTYMDFKYAKSTDALIAPELDETQRNPYGWSDSVMAVDEGEYLWMTSALIASDDSLARNWATPSRLTGSKGEQGSQGIQGATGVSQYLHIRYSDSPDGNPMTTTPAKYIGMAVTVENAAPIDPDLYTPWKQFVGQQGATGEQGIQGPPGDDGKPTYFHVKYSNDGGLSFTPAIGEEGEPGYIAPGETPGDYMGTYADYIELDSNSVSDYKWAKIKGEQGEPGKQGTNGRTMYPVGEYDENTVYTATDTSAPYVLFKPNNTYYYMNITTKWQGIVDGRTPAEDYNAYGKNATWLPMEDFEAVYTKLLIANGGNLGNFVFSGDYMFSQQGKDEYNNTSTDYSKFGNDPIDMFQDLGKKGHYFTFDGYVGGNSTTRVTYNRFYNGCEITSIPSADEFRLFEPDYWGYSKIPSLYITVDNIESNNITVIYRYVGKGDDGNNVVKEFEMTKDKDSPGYDMEEYVLDNVLNEQCGVFIKTTSAQTFTSDYPTVKIYVKTFSPNFSVNSVNGTVQMTSGFSSVPSGGSIGRFPIPGQSFYNIDLKEDSECSIYDIYFANVPFDPTSGSHQAVITMRIPRENVKKWKGRVVTFRFDAEFITSLINGAKKIYHQHEPNDIKCNILLRFIDYPVYTGGGEPPEQWFWKLQAAGRNAFYHHVLLNPYATLNVTFTTDFDVNIQALKVTSAPSKLRIVVLNSSEFTAGTWYNSTYNKNYKCLISKTY